MYHKPIQNLFRLILSNLSKLVKHTPNYPNKFHTYDFHLVVPRTCSAILGEGCVGIFRANEMGCVW